MKADPADTSSLALQPTSISPHLSSYNLHTFFEKFDLFADAPDAVARMRGLILRLAMQGTLSEPHETDGPVSELLRAVETDKIRLSLESSAKAKSGSSDFLEDETADLIPARWTWVRFGNVALHNAGKTLDKGRNRGELRDYITTSNLYWGFFQLEAVRQMPMLDDELERCTAIKGDLLICEGGEAGRAAVWPHDYEISFQNHVHRARFFAGIDPYFVQRYFEKLNVTGEINKYRKGVGISNMSGKALASIPIPLPPLAEQKRIVAKVDELMALCDRLEAQQQERETRHAALARASLARFADAPAPINLQFLFHSSYTIAPADLRKSILTLAVQGKLVPQEEDSETKAISMEELVGRKNLKNGLSLAPIDVASDYVCLPLSAIKDSMIDCSFGKPIALTSDRAKPYLVKPGDIFVMRGNGSKERVGIAGMVRSCPSNVLFPDLLIRVPLPLDKITGEYFLIAWNSPVTRQMLESFATTTSGIWKVNQGHISQCEIPFPPIAEQRRIVAKVDQLMALVDQLEAQLAASRATAANLLTALVAELTTQA